MSIPEATIMDGTKQTQLGDLQATIQISWNKEMTASEVGALVGLSRAAVLGHIKRMRAKGYELRSAPLNLVKKVKGESAPGSFKKKAIINSIFDNGKTPEQHEAAEAKRIPPSREIKPANDGAGILITDLVFSSCRAIINTDGDHEEWRYCGSDITAGRGAYCNGHRAIYYQEPQKRTRTNMTLSGVRKLHD